MKKTVLITGASRGIGAATAYCFAKEGYNVVVNYNKSREKAEKLVSELTNQGFSAACIQADVSDGLQVNAMVDKINSRFGGVDVLVNNAAVAQIKLFSDITSDDWDNIFNVNVKGMFNCTKAVLPYMIHQKHGKIVNISSIWGITGASCEVHYSASKAAVIGLTKALAKELGPSGIQVNCVAPGVVNTDMNAELSKEDIEQIADETPLGVIGNASDIANTVCFLASDKADFITGQVISPNGGLVI